MLDETCLSGPLWPRLYGTDVDLILIYSSFNTGHKDRSVATAFIRFSFYLKSNAENQILQGHTNQKETPKNKNIYRGFDISSTSIRTSPRASAVHVGACPSRPRCRQSRSQSSHHNQPLCFRKLL